jgi:hypothetical protein
MKGRSVVEIMALTFTFITAFGILATGALVAIIEIRDPTTDTEALVDVLFALMTTIVGGLLGLLAGKSEQVNLDRRPASDPGSEGA